MDCNKEEAIRAMEVAEKKMQSKDFVSARKMASRAQHLHPDLANISQMILVCDVHCAAENKVHGAESDWYGILQIEPTANEAAIKKQYRKFALSLHPDKNKFAGASDAFKMIGEAQKVLLDNEKRILFDSKCKAVGKYQASRPATHQGNRQTNVRGHPWFQNKFTSSSTSQFVNQQSRQQQQQPQQQQQQTQSNTFWTACPFCSVKYQYYKEVLNKTLSCQSCKKSFTGYEMDPPTELPGANSSQPSCPQRGAFSKGNSTSVPQSTCKSSSRKATQGSANIKNLNGDSYAKKRFTTTVGEESKQKKRRLNVDSRNAKVRRKKRHILAESSESESGSESGGDCLPGQSSGYQGDQNTRRSTRSKQQVAYDENLSEDDEANLSKRSNCSGSFNGAADIKENKIKVKEKGVPAFDDVLQNGEADTEESSDPKLFDIPDSEFHDFDKDRSKECFDVGQMWAIYDTVEAMPRFYAEIKKVHTPGFALQITWLEVVSDNEDKRRWDNEDLPISCGKFSYGTTQKTADLSMFSHRVDYKKCEEDTFEIYPKKGETWALFKNWDVNWNSDTHGEGEYEYEYVEVLSDYEDNCGVRVAQLGKLKGFAFLFCRTLMDASNSFLILPKDILRFSHKIPSFQMTGKEGLFIPQGSFELDPAALPAKLDVIEVCPYNDTDARHRHPNGLHSGSPEDILKPKEKAGENVSPSQSFGLKVESNGNAAWADLVDLVEDSEENEASADKVELKANSVRTSVSSSAEKEDSQNCTSNGLDSRAKRIEDSSFQATEAYEIPEPEFYNFDAEKAEGKFQVGQIWAVYGDEDALPKYYGKIKKIDSPPRYALHLMWLVPCSLSADVILWTDNKMPICCGKFKLGKGKPQMFTSIAPFSHQLKVPSSDKNVYSIYPEKGDIWALYRHWSPAMTCSDLDNCEYDIVEVLEQNDKGITVSFLELVAGFKSVYKPQIVEQSRVTRQILWAELLKFSHHIPAFRLTDEKGGSLRGFWELDPAALPTSFLNSS